MGSEGDTIVGDCGLMGDSELSASELRQRYLRGGTVRDDELTSAQLRARHAIPSNNKDFSTGEGGSQQSGGSSQVVFVLAVVFALLAVAVGAYFLLAAAPQSQSQS